MIKIIILNAHKLPPTTKTFPLHKCIKGKKKRKKKKREKQKLITFGIIQKAC